MTWPTKSRGATLLLVTLAALVLLFLQRDGGGDRHQRDVARLLRRSVGASKKA